MQFCGQTEKNKTLGRERNEKSLIINPSKQRMSKKRRLEKNELSCNETENKISEVINEPFLMINHLKICKFFLKL